ncbi:PTP type protein phosphatase [Trinorchestia longiramus]|nr:PTP type protein phosphatase [Trinorchestia longiramus]
MAIKDADGCSLADGCSVFSSIDTLCCNFSQCDPSHHEKFFLQTRVELKYQEPAVVRRVSHYHFTKWPDHGVPAETLTLSQMLKHIATSHVDLNAVVHCSAGIGRTGTVIYDLICYDYLMFHGKVNLMQVLEDMRASRARLVENQMQFKLSLQLLDEILFGFQTVIQVSELEDAMESSLQECRGWFQRLNNLPSPLVFSTASWNENLPFNRSPNVLPADSHRIFVQNTSGQQQYINAIRVDGLQCDTAYVVTEHPLPGRLEAFWNLVLSKKSPFVVLLNAHYDEEFPEIFPRSDDEIVAGPVKVQTTSQAFFGSDLIAHRLSVTNGKSTMAVTGYEVTGWRRGEPSPPDVTCLVRLADALHSSAVSAAGPPVLVCGDGVTACGLAAGVLRVIDRMKEKQDIDIYRTAVKLRRCRSQFFVDETQLQQMLLAAQVYLSEFQDYGNFK